MKNFKLVFFISSILWMQFSGSLFALNSITPGEIYTDASLNHIGLRFQVTDDDDLDSSCTVRYRLTGSQSWKEGMPLLRTHPDIVYEGNDTHVRPDNRFAGSLFFIDPGTSYDIELVLSDPDGGGETRMVTVITGKEQMASPSSTQRYVEPGNGGGAGTKTDPYQGLQEACDNAMPGDVFNVSAGIYNAFSLTTSGQKGKPIVLRGAVNPNLSPVDSEWTIIDGGNTDRGVLTIGEYAGQTSNIIVENMVIQNGRWGIDAQNTQHIRISNNVIRDVDYGYYNRRDNGLDGYQMLSDNLVTGRTLWPGSGIPSERGIDLRGTGNIVCYNSVKNFGDGISIQPFSDSYGFSNDIYGNDIANIVDDPIEIDYNSCNTRVWRNRVVNGRMGVSLAPVYGGPVYIFRNEFFNLESSAYKMNRNPAGLYIIHNTSVKLSNGTSSDSGWQNTYLRNNVIIGTRYVFEEYGLVAGSIDNWDYDALGTTYSSFAKWDGTRYNSIAELRAASGIEAHSVAISINDLVNTTLPSSYGDGITPGSYDMSLKNGVAAIDAGETLPNINDPFVTDGKPDCGAFEYGKAMPLYGPRNGSGSNQAPNADAGPDQSVEPGLVVNLDGTGSNDSDAGDSITTYTWEQTAGISVILSNTGSATPSFTSPDGVTSEETLVFNLVVTDTGGMTGNDSCIVTIMPSGTGRNSESVPGSSSGGGCFLGTSGYN